MNIKYQNPSNVDVKKTSRYITEKATALQIATGLLIRCLLFSDETAGR